MFYNVAMLLYANVATMTKLLTFCRFLHLSLIEDLKVLDERYLNDSLNPKIQKIINIIVGPNMIHKENKIGSWVGEKDQRHTRKTEYIQTYIYISANSTWITTARVYVLVSAHYPMSALSTVIICRQVAETATAVAFFLKMTSGVFRLVST